MEKESHLLDELEKLSVRAPRDRSQPSGAFTLLQDVPVDGYDGGSSELRVPSASASVPNWLLARSEDARPPLRSDIGTIRSVHFDEVSLHSSSDPNRPEGGKEGSERSQGGLFTLRSAARRSRPSLPEAFRPGPEQQLWSRHMNGHQAAQQNGLSSSQSKQEFKLQTVSISKTKQSLGKLI